MVFPGGAFRRSEERKAREAREETARYGVLVRGHGKGALTVPEGRLWRHLFENERRMLLECVDRGMAEEAGFYARRLVGLARAAGRDSMTKEQRVKGEKIKRSLELGDYGKYYSARVYCENCQTVNLIYVLLGVTKPRAVECARCGCATAR